MKPNTSKSSTGSDDHKMQDLCIVRDCKQPAVSHPEWDNEYCSIKCCYNHCKTAFQSWIEINKAAIKAKAEADAEAEAEARAEAEAKTEAEARARAEASSQSSSSIQVPGPSSQHTET